MARGMVQQRFHYFSAASSDNVWLFAMRFMFATAFREVPVPDHLAALETDFEREFVARGVTILRLSYRCDTDGSPDAPRTTGCVR